MVISQERREKREERREKRMRGERYYGRIRCESGRKEGSKTKDKRTEKLEWNQNK